MLPVGFGVSSGEFLFCSKDDRRDRCFLGAASLLLVGVSLGVTGLVLLDLRFFLGDTLLPWESSELGVFLPEDSRDRRRLELLLMLEDSESLLLHSLALKATRRWSTFNNVGCKILFSTSWFKDSVSLGAGESDMDDAHDEEDSNEAEGLSGSDGGLSSVSGPGIVALTAVIMSSCSEHTNFPSPMSNMLSVMSIGQNELGHSLQSLVAGLPHTSQ